MLVTSDPNGDVLIPFDMMDAQIPFMRWQMVSEMVWQSPGPVSVRSVILTHDGKIYVQYAKEVNSQDEYPKEGVKEGTIELNTSTIVIPGESLITRDEKRRYE